MSVVRLVAAVVCSAVVVFGGTPANAGDGFPPNGAWVYGSRPYGSVRSRATYWPRSTVYRTHYSGWGGYGNLGYSNVGYGRVHYGSMTRVRSGLNYWPHVSVPTRYYHHVHHYRHYPVSYYGYGGYGYGYGLPYYVYSPFAYSPFGYSRIGYSGISLSTYGGFGLYTSFSFPSIYYSSYRVPTLPYCRSSYPVVIPWSYSVQSPVLYSGADCTASSATPPVTYSVSKPTVDSVETSVVQSDAVPAELIDAADAIFRAGGYREAATAYARLSVRYGSSSRLYGRRFIAQLASGEMSQAIVVSASAHLSGSELTRADLPEGDLASLGLGTERIEELQEELAATALAQPDDAAALVAVADWLRLSGDDARADLFSAGAAEVTRHAESEGDRSSNSELVSLE